MNYSLLLQNFFSNFVFIGAIIFLVVLAIMVWDVIQKFLNGIRRNPNPFIVIVLLIVLALIMAVAQTRGGDPSGGW